MQIAYCSYIVPLEVWGSTGLTKHDENGKFTTGLKKV